MDLDNTAEQEIELLRRVGAGDQAAFEAFYDRFAKVLFATAYRIVNDHSSAEDVIQEVFVQIWEKAPLYDPSRGKPLTWAMTLTRNKAIDRLRSTQRRVRLNESAEREAEVFDHLDHHDSLESLDLIEKGQIMRSAMAELPKEQREAIELAFFSGLTQAEIAEHFSEPIGTIKARIRRGMLRLRDALASRL